MSRPPDAEDPEAETVAFLGESRDPAAARKRQFGGIAWYFSIPYLSTEFLRERLRETGGHLYCTKDLYLSAGRGLISVHAPAEGEYTLSLKNGRTVTLFLKIGETAVLDAESGEWRLPRV